MDSGSIWGLVALYFVIAVCLAWCSILLPDEDSSFFTEGEIGLMCLAWLPVGVLLFLAGVVLGVRTALRIAFRPLGRP